MAVKKGTSGKNKLTGTSSRDTLDGLGGDDILLGAAGADLLLGGTGNDTLDGGTGADTLNGGAGNDAYIVDSTTDKIIEASGGGTDRVSSSVDYTLALNVEQLTLTGAASNDAIGNTLANLLTGNAGANRLDGKTGADSMVGGAGNDTYVVDNAGDKITDTAGIDTVESSIAYVLGSTLERLTLTGSAAVNGTGNTLANVLIGNSGNNRLDGGSGADTMSGGSGNDTYVVDDAGDVVTDTAGTADTVESAITYTLGAGIERLTLTGTAATNGTGNALDNVLTGNSASNTLDGGAGADSLNGGSGDDTLLYDAEDASAVGGLGTDLLKVTTSAETIDLSATTALAGIERIDLGADGALVLTDAELRALSDTDALQIDGSGTAAITATGGLWTSVGTFSGYARYTLNGATLNVALAVDRTGIEQNQAPDAVADDFSTDEDAALVIDLVDLLINDTDPNDGQTLSVTGFGDAPHGTVVNNGDGTYTYTPDANYNGADSFTYTLSDGAGGTATGTVNLTIASVNDAPTGAAAISGVPAIGQVLTAGVGTLADADGLGALSSYQWQRSADGTTGWTDITNETNATYTVDVADDTAFLRVVVGYTDGAGTSETANSAASTRVTAASAGNDVLNGTAGVDVINALAGDDEVNGLAGNDTLAGSAGDDTLNGGDDDDLLNGGADSDALNGGAGNDTADYSDRTASVVVDLSGGEVIDGADSYLVRASADGATLNAYRLVQTASTFAEARAGAAGLSFGGASGHLVTITSSAEQLDLLATLVNPNSPGTNALANPWIALSDALQEGNWQWLEGPETGTTVTTPFWASGEPTEAASGVTPVVPSTTGELLANDPDDGTGNSNLLFFAWDTTGKSYLQGLPVRLDEFLAAPTTTLSYSLSGLATQFAGSPEAYWGVIAADAANGGAGTYLGYRLLTSTPVDYAATTADFANTALLNGAIKSAAFFLRDFEGTASGAYPNGPWPLQLSDATDPSNAGLLGLDVNGQGPVTVGGLVDGSQLFSWLGTASSNLLPGKPTFTQYGNWTLSLATNTLTYTDATFEYAKLGPDGWFDSKADTTSWYIAEFENVSVTPGSNTALAIVGGALEDRLTGIENLRGGSANDRLTGDASANRLEGNGGDDLLAGAGGDDTLLGGAANDELNGGTGADLLTGGTGNDVFVFNAALGAGNVDTIADFEGAGATAGDSIRLDDTVFTVLSAGTLAASAFQTGTTDTASSADARVIYNSSTGALFYDADGSGSGSSAVQFATLTGAPAGLSAADFTVLGKPPVAGDDSRSVNEDGTLSITKASLLGNDTDPNGDTLSIASFTQPTHGVLVDTGTGYTYTPTGNYFGADSFTYTVSDGKGGTDTATVSLVVNAVNDAPTGTPSSVLPTVAQDQTDYVISRAQLLAGLSDVDGDTLSVSSISASHGTLVENTGDGSYSYTPDTAYTGADTLSFTVSDGRGGSLSTSLGLTVALPGTADYSAQTASVVVSLSGGLVTQGGNDYLVRANGTGAQQNAYLLTETASTFQQAVAGAESNSFNGVSGHLVTITSAGENSDLLAAFVTPNSPGTNALANPWIGLSDALVEGVWRWVAGPEFNAGTTVSTSSTFWQTGNPTEAASSASTVTPATTGALLENAPNAGTGNSSLLFYAFDETGHFYLQGLPLQMDSLIGSTTTDFRYALSGLSSFFSSVSDVKWGIVASDTVTGGLGTYLGYRFMGSVADDVVVDTVNNFTAKAGAQAFLSYFNLVDGLYSGGPWPLQVNDALDEAFPLKDGSFGFGFAGNGPTSVGSFIDGAQLFAWQFSASSNTLGGAATAVRYGNWTLDLDTNTVTYTNATTEYAKLGPDGWFDAKSTDTSWYISEFENVSLPGDAVVTESYAYINGVKTDTLTDKNHVFGGSGNDTLIGNALANQLKGNGGADVLSGEGGNDTLTGGTGDDQFWFTGALNATSNLDLIADFEGAGTAGGDVIALDDAIFTALSGTTDFTSVFQSGTTDVAGGAAIRLVYNSTTGALFYDTDGDGAEAAVQFATLTGAPALAAGDFLMV